MPKREADRYGVAATDVVLRARNSAHLTQEDLAEQLVKEVGGTKTAQRVKVADWERHRYIPSGSALLAVLKITAYSLDDYMEDAFGIRPRRRQEDDVSKDKRRLRRGPAEGPRTASK